MAEPGRVNAGFDFSGDGVVGGVLGVPGVIGVGVSVTPSVSDPRNPSFDTSWAIEVETLDLGVQVGYSATNGWFGYVGFSEIGGFITGTTAFAGVGYSQGAGFGGIFSGTRGLSGISCVAG